MLEAGDDCSVGPPSCGCVMPSSQCYVDDGATTLSCFSPGSVPSQGDCRVARCAPGTLCTYPGACAPVCPDGQSFCVDLFTEDEQLVAQAHVSLAPCDPTAGGCGLDTDCQYDGLNPQNGFHTACGPVGAQLVDDMCHPVLLPCAPGLTCDTVSSTCREMCRLGTLCSDLTLCPGLVVASDTMFSYSFCP